LCAVVGLELSVRCFPGGQPIRDVAQAALLARFRGRLHNSVRWAAEVPLPRPGDQRAWDALVTGSGWRFGVEAETAPRDGQALARRLELKRRDGQVDGVILVLPNTRRTRTFLREFVSTAAESFPVSGERALELASHRVAARSWSFDDVPWRGAPGERTETKGHRRMPKSVENVRLVQRPAASRLVPPRKCTR